VAGSGWPVGVAGTARAAGESTLRVCRLGRIGYSSERTPLVRMFGGPGLVADADVAQLVAHHLAKVRVAGSNPVVRSRCRKPSREPTDRTALRYQPGSSGVRLWRNGRVA
jgi:hypothetical protein